MATQPRAQLTLTDAVYIGAGSMIGAGLFAAFAPAAAAAGNWLLLSLALAAFLAFANATSSAQLAAQHSTPNQAAPTSTAAASSAMPGALQRGGASSSVKRPAAPLWP